MEIIGLCMAEKLIIEPIGTLHSELSERYETPHQGILAGKSLAEVHLHPHRNFEQAIKNIEGFGRLWIIYCFHKNTNWKPLVKPPRLSGKKIGVFATRSPFRPNPIGLSCVKLERVEGLKIFISESDILDGSPVLDIKPYLPYSDSFPNASTGWVRTDLENMYDVVFQKDVEEYATNLKQKENVNLLSYAKVQLQFNPADTSRKRISVSENDTYILAYQKWRIFYRVNEEARQVIVNLIIKK